MGEERRNILHGQRRKHLKAGKRKGAMGEAQGRREKKIQK